MLLESLLWGISKKYDMPPFLTIEKIGRHGIVAVYQMVAKFFQLPFDTPPSSDGD
jgi:hypothetical protein